MKQLSILIILAVLAMTGLAAAQDSLSLDECITLALKNNCAVRNSSLELKASQQARLSALTEYFPNISAGGLVFKADDPLANVALGPISLGLLEKGSTEFLTVTQPIFTGGRIVNGNRLAGVGVDASRLKEQVTREEVVLRTEEQYWQILSLKEKAKTLRAYEEMLDRLLKQIEDAYESGVVMQNDVLRVRLKRSEVLLNKSRLDNAIELSLMAFRQYLGLPLDSVVYLRDSIVEIVDPMELRVDHNHALPGRNEYQLLELSVKAAHLKTQITVGEHLPSVVVGANYINMHIDDGDASSKGMIFGMISVPLSGWWSGSHDVRKQKHEEKIAEHSARDNMELLLLQMKKSWQDLSDSYTQYLLSVDAHLQATENMKVNQDSYDNGLTPVSDLLDARALLQQTQDQMAEARAHFLTERSRYLQVTGRLHV